MFYESLLYFLIRIGAALCILSGIIIVIFYSGFVPALIYMGSVIGAFVLTRCLIAPILLEVFTYHDLGAILPSISSLGFAAYMFTQISSL